MGFVEVSIYILNVLMILIGIYLFILYLKSKDFQTYSTFNILFMSLTILLDNITRIIPSKSLPNFFHYLQAFILVLCDKMILSFLSMQIVVIYIAIMWEETYFKNEKKIFIIGTIICIAISAVITSLFIWIPNELYEGSSYYYCVNKWKGKIIIDVVFNSILLCLNFFCIVVLLVYFSKKKKEVESGKIEDYGYKEKFIRFLILFFINILFITESFLIIYEKLPGNVDFIYLCSCLVVDLCYSINSNVIKETKKLFCRKKTQIPIEGYGEELVIKNTFGEDVDQNTLGEDD